MQLFYSPMSPFARKVRVVAYEAELAGRIEVAMVNPMAGEALRAVNPLSKVPTLVTDEGVALYDSRVICEYLDDLGGGGMFPAGEARWDALLLQALGDGVGDAAVRVAYERRRDEDDRHPDVIERQLAAVAAGLDVAERGDLSVERFRIGEIALASVLGYIDFRSIFDWRPGRPRLEAWFEAVSKRASMVATEPVQMA